MSDNKGRFLLYYDTSKFTLGIALYQIQHGQLKLKTYTTKRIPTGGQDYSITKLELCRLAISITIFSELLKTVDFDVVVDHLVLTYIMRGKSEPTTIKIKRLLEILRSYKFGLSYLKDKDMLLSDFLSRMEGDKSDPLEVISISFDSHSILTEQYYTFSNLPQKHTV